MRCKIANSTLYVAIVVGSAACIGEIYLLTTWGAGR